MPADMYDDAGNETESDTGSEEYTNKERAEEAEGKTATIDSAICPGMEAGDDMVLHIEKVLDGQYLVSYSPEPGKGEPEGEESEEAPMGRGYGGGMGEGSSRMASMYE